MSQALGEHPAGPRIRPTVLEIDLSRVRHNAAVLTARAAARLCAVVKADGYGHGAVEIARALQGDVSCLAVSLVEEGAELRDAGITAPILVMGPAMRGGYAEMIARGLTPMVSDVAALEALATLGRDRGRPVAVHLKIDTGMNRLGIPVDAVDAAVRGAIAGGGLTIDGLATHLACADGDDPADPRSMTRAQLAAFDHAIAVARAAGARPHLLHAANSSGTLLFPEARYDLVRCGLALYGNWARDGYAVPELQQAMRLRTEIVQIRDVPAGSAVSYGAMWRASRPARLAVLPVGYADGMPRRLTGSAEALIHGRRCPLVGAISMDIAIADVTAIGDAAAVGDEVVLLGEQGDEQITCAELAERAGLTAYEVTCGMSKRVPRVYRSA